MSYSLCICPCILAPVYSVYHFSLLTVKTKKLNYTVILPSKESKRIVFDADSQITASLQACFAHTTNINLHASGKMGVNLLDSTLHARFLKIIKELSVQHQCHDNSLLLSLKNLTSKLKCVLCHH